MDLLPDTQIDYAGIERRVSRRERSDSGAEISWHVGDWAETLSLGEILATLDNNACFEGIPFMPEMASYCGRRYQVIKVAHKTCDTGWPYLRSMTNAVHLETRCDGMCHGGCQAGCLFFWKTAWLRKVSGAKPEVVPKPTEANPILHALVKNSVYAPGTGGDDVRYRCQATEIARVGKPISPLEPLQYFRDVSSGNIAFGIFARQIVLAILRTGKVWLLAAAQFIKRGLEAKINVLSTRSPVSEPLDLQPGEFVRVKSWHEILQTLNSDRKNFGLLFDADMKKYCGTTHEVVCRVERIIDEKTGQMMQFSRDCLILRNVICTGLDCRSRLFCPRGLYTFWREAWLERVHK